MPRSCRLPLRLLWPQQRLCNSSSTEVPGRAEPVAAGSAGRGLGVVCAGAWPHPNAEQPRPRRAAAQPWGCSGHSGAGDSHLGVPMLPTREDGGGLGGCPSIGFAPRALTAALPAATRVSLGEVRVVVQSFLFYILLCHAAPAAERARNSCQSREVSLQGLYSRLAGVARSSAQGARREEQQRVPCGAPAGPAWLRGAAVGTARPGGRPAAGSETPGCG